MKPGVTVLGLKEGALDVAMDEHNARLVTPAMRAAVESARQDIIAGRLKVIELDMEAPASLKRLQALGVTGHVPVVLLIDGQNNHAWQQTTPVLKKQLEGSGRFTVDVATSKMQRRFAELCKTQAG